MRGSSVAMLVALHRYRTVLSSGVRMKDTLLDAILPLVVDTDSISSQSVNVHTHHLHSDKENYIKSLNN